MTKREEDIGFGDYVEIEQKRYYRANEMYLHKVINTLNSNSWVDVPVQTPETETLHEVKELEPVVSCICCGVQETEVRKYRIKDVKKVAISSNPDFNYERSKRIPKVVETIDVGTRWEQGIEHDPRSEEIVRWIADYDFLFCDDYFCWKVGGDGDNGESLMYELDEYFAAKEKENNDENNV
jgi:hypothetical protein